jgi:peptidoglycan/LPS O-acetylase OafA/YrhL
MIVPMKTPASPSRGYRLALVAVLASVCAVGLLHSLGVIDVTLEIGETAHRAFNYAEAALWAAVGVGLLWRPGAGRRGDPWLGRLAGAIFLAFGASDVVETTTGSWYDPPWLFWWKAACVACLLACLVLHALRTRKGPERSRCPRRGWLWYHEVQARKVAPPNNAPEEGCHGDSRGQQPH